MTPPEGGKDCTTPPPPPAETREPSDPATAQSCGARHLIVTLAFTTSCCLSGVVFGWPALAVARELLAGVKSAQLPCLEPAHAEVIAALATGALDDHGRDGWREWFLGAKDYLYVALCVAAMTKTLWNCYCSSFDVEI